MEEAKNQPTTIDYPKRTWEEMKSSDHPLDRLAVYINDLSPHNLWRAREAIDYIFDERFAQAIERAKPDYPLNEGYTKMQVDSFLNLYHANLLREFENGGSNEQD